ncbi:RNA methyltransferase [Gramella sp. KN1008]|uniref:TrmH family RNA methyltransferase n=1 Tax=Gramella sp. KN1008 TaxID=2529298 RepID=UPI00103EA196|nr:RNA methyltransferase [Gramella sp. KN1008]TBW30368.1 RNA methyltransferase [Gramella sp. KN1008]
MVSKNQIKLIKSLSQKKFRNKHELFVVEGVKSIREFLKSSFSLVSLFTTGASFEVPKELFQNINERELGKISFLTTPQQALAVFQIPEEEMVEIEGLTIILDGIRDPGNLGTIIRLCDWFGIKNLVCSRDTVDCYNPKVVQASMGSLTRVKVSYTDLKELLMKNDKIPVYGAMLDGENLYESTFPETAFIVMGNEANGVSKEIEGLLTNRINIPQFGKRQETESLNVATATAVILSEFRRGHFIEK